MTPMMEQYFQVKNQYKDYILFYRLGDFYEMFFDDAKLASKELELTLTGRDCGLEERAPMCGVPFHAAQTYITRLVAKGYKDITLLGQNVNSYGKGEAHGMDFADLLERLDAIEGDFILRFMTSHPKDATRKLVDVMAGGKHIAHHFHLPLQSGSDAILKQMNRHYDRAAYLDILDYMREKMPDLAVTSDIIVGFPGETDADFEDTLAMLQRARFDMIYSFIYSPRKGTPAAEMADQIPKEVSAKRFERLLALQEALSLAANEPLLHKTLRVLCDGASKTDAGMLSGRTEQNKIVFWPDDGTEAGAWVWVEIDRVAPFALYGNKVK